MGLDGKRRVLYNCRLANTSGCRGCRWRTWLRKIFLLEIRSSAKRQYQISESRICDSRRRWVCLAPVCNGGGADVHGGQACDDESPKEQQHSQGGGAREVPPAIHLKRIYTKFQPLRSAPPQRPCRCDPIVPLDSTVSAKHKTFFVCNGALVWIAHRKIVTSFLNRSMNSLNVRRRQQNSVVFRRSGE